MELGFPVRQILFSLLLLGDVRHHRDRATPVHPTAENAIPPPVRRVILEAQPRRIAQTLHALRDQRIDVALAVVAVLGQIAQQIGIGTAGLQQLLRHLVHLFEAVVADDDPQIAIGVDERARHVVEHEMELADCIRRRVIGHVHVEQSGAADGVRDITRNCRWRTFVMAPPLVALRPVYTWGSSAGPRRRTNLR